MSRRAPGSRLSSGGGGGGTKYPRSWNDWQPRWVSRRPARRPDPWAPPRAGRGLRPRGWEARPRPSTPPGTGRGFLGLLPPRLGEEDRCEVRPKCLPSSPWTGTETLGAQWSHWPRSWVKEGEEMGLLVGTLFWLPPSPRVGES